MKRTLVLPKWLGYEYGRIYIEDQARIMFGATVIWQDPILPARSVR